MAAEQHDASAALRADTGTAVSLELLSNEQIQATRYLQTLGRPHIASQSWYAFLSALRGNVWGAFAISYVVLS